MTRRRKQVLAFGANHNIHTAGNNPTLVALIHVLSGTSNILAPGGPRRFGSTRRSNPAKIDDHPPMIFCGYARSMLVRGISAARAGSEKHSCSVRWCRDSDQITGNPTDAPLS
jgi:hypothetical protein